MEIEVGDRVTYEVEGIKAITENNNMCTMKTVKEKRMAIVIADEVNVDNCQIIKIERIGTNGWYTVYEKDKELLTEEEREFLKQYIKFNGKEIDFIEKSGHYIKFYIKQIFNDYLETSRFYYYRSFENLKENKKYTLSELGLEE